MLFWLTIILYAGFRFVKEFFRGDSPFPAAGRLKPIPYLLVIAIFYFGYVFLPRERNADKQL